MVGLVFVPRGSLYLAKTVERVLEGVKVACFQPGVMTRPSPNPRCSQALLRRPLCSALTYTWCLVHIVRSY